MRPESVPDARRSFAIRRDQFRRLRQELRGLTRPASAWIARRDAELMDLLIAVSLRSDACAVDVGANEGAVLRRILRAAPAGRHLAFEPLPRFAARLRREFPGVEVHQAALSDAPGTRDFHFVASNPGYSGLRRRRYDRPAETVEVIPVETRRLDDVVPADRHVALVKIDVEGAELEVLRGAEATLARCKPVVLFEHGRGAADCYGTTPELVHDWFRERVGFSVFTLDGGGPLSRAEFARIFREGTAWNFLARDW